MITYRLYKHLLLAGILLLVTSCSVQPVRESSDRNTQWVDPYIGTGGHGHAFLGANVPFGFVQLGPTEYTRGWDWCSGYHYSDSVLLGFSHTHLGGTGIGDLGDILFLPAISREKKEARFSHADENVSPGYYSVRLPESGIRVELTATARTGFHRYHFSEKSDSARVRVDLQRGIGWDKWVSSGLKQQNDTVITGYRHSSGWAKKQEIYFSAHFSQPVRLTVDSDSIGMVMPVAMQGDVLSVKVGLSAVSEENADLNLKEEQPGWDFEQAVSGAEELWNRELSKIQFETHDEAARRIFYTALYHTMIAPSVFCDVNGDYRGADGKVYRNAGFTNYTTWSLWDTYRAAHPLATLIHGGRMKDFAETMLAIYREQGKLPVWHLVGNETDCMVGNPGIPVLADMVLKGVEVDKEAAFEAMRASAMKDERSLDLLKQYGYIPYDKEPTNETAAKGLEYALADWCVAQIAQELGKDGDFDYFNRRSRSYHYYFDKETRFMRGLSSEGKFSEPFSPFYTAPGKGDYTEGNAWQYAWLVPHDVHGLIELFGGEQAFAEKLDSLFVVEGDLGEEAAPDVSGLIGQYAHGNEPSHHVIYLYNYVGQPWKAARRLRQVFETLYHDAPDGLCGNEDVGQMSAWYVLSALGLYQVAPAGGVYVLGSPIMDKAVIQVGNGKTFTVIVYQNSSQNIYVQSAKLNGLDYTKSYIHYRDIMDGGVLELFMGDAPSDTFGVAPEDRP